MFRSCAFINSFQDGIDFTGWSSHHAILSAQMNCGPSFAVGQVSAVAQEEEGHGAERPTKQKTQNGLGSWAKSSCSHTPKKYEPQHHNMLMHKISYASNSIHFLSFCYKIHQQNLCTSVNGSTRYVTLWWPFLVTFYGVWTPRGQGQGLRFGHRPRQGEHSDAHQGPHWLFGIERLGFKLKHLGTKSSQYIYIYISIFVCGSSISPNFFKSIKKPIFKLWDWKIEENPTIWH